MDNPENKAEVEDFLQEQCVFFNGIRGEEHKAHMDSYMTCINFNKLKECWDKLKDKFSTESWQYMIKAWKFHAYCSPNCGILAAMIEFYMKENPLNPLNPLNPSNPINPQD